MQELGVSETADEQAHLMHTTTFQSNYGAWKNKDLVPCFLTEI